MLIPTFWTLDWSVDEIYFIVVKTHKTLTSIGNFHTNSHIDELYLKGDAGLRSVKKAVECRIVSIGQHLQNSNNNNTQI